MNSLLEESNQKQQNEIQLRDFLLVLSKDTEPSKQRQMLQDVLAMGREHITQQQQQKLNENREGLPIVHEYLLSSQTFVELLEWKRMSTNEESKNRTSFNRDLVELQIQLLQQIIDYYNLFDSMESVHQAVNQLSYKIIHAKLDELLNFLKWSDRPKIEQGVLRIFTNLCNRSRKIAQKFIQCFDFDAPSFMKLTSRKEKLSTSKVSDHATLDTRICFVQLLLSLARQADDRNMQFLLKPGSVFARLFRSIDGDRYDTIDAILKGFQDLVLVKGEFSILLKCDLITEQLKFMAVLFASENKEICKLIHHFYCSLCVDDVYGIFGISQEAMVDHYLNPTKTLDQSKPILTIVTLLKHLMEDVRKHGFDPNGILLQLLRKYPILSSAYCQNIRASMEPRVSFRWYSELALTTKVLCVSLDPMAHEIEQMLNHELQTKEGDSFLKRIIPFIAASVMERREITRGVQHDCKIVVLSCISFIQQIFRRVAFLQSCLLQCGQENWIPSTEEQVLTLLPSPEILLALIFKYQKDFGSQSSRLCWSGFVNLLGLYFLHFPHAMSHFKLDLHKICSPQLIEEGSPFMAGTVATFILRISGSKRSSMRLLTTLFGRQEEKEMLRSDQLTDQSISLSSFVALVRRYCDCKKINRVSNKRQLLASIFEKMLVNVLVSMNVFNGDEAQIHVSLTHLTELNYCYFCKFVSEMVFSCYKYIDKEMATFDPEIQFLVSGNEDGNRSDYDDVHTSVYRWNLIHELMEIRGLKFNDDCSLESIIKHHFETLDIDVHGNRIEWVFMNHCLGSWRDMKDDKDPTQRVATLHTLLDDKLVEQGAWTEESIRALFDMLLEMDSNHFCESIPNTISRLMKANFDSNLLKFILFVKKDSFFNAKLIRDAFISMDKRNKFFRSFSTTDMLQAILQYFSCMVREKNEKGMRLASHLLEVFKDSMFRMPDMNSSILKSQICKRLLYNLMKFSTCESVNATNASQEFCCRMYDVFLKLWLNCLLCQSDVQTSLIAVRHILESSKEMNGKLLHKVKGIYGVMKRGLKIFSTQSYQAMHEENLNEGNPSLSLTPWFVQSIERIVFLPSLNVGHLNQLIQESLTQDIRADKEEETQNRIATKLSPHVLLLLNCLLLELFSPRHSLHPGEDQRLYGKSRDTLFRHLSRLPTLAQAPVVVAALQTSVRFARSFINYTSSGSTSDSEDKLDWPGFEDCLKLVLSGQGDSTKSGSEKVYGFLVEVVSFSRQFSDRFGRFLADRLDEIPLFSSSINHNDNNNNNKRRKLSSSNVLASVWNLMPLLSMWVNSDIMAAQEGLPHFFESYALQLITALIEQFDWVREQCISDDLDIDVPIQFLEGSLKVASTYIAPWMRATAFEQTVHDFISNSILCLLKVSGSTLMKIDQLKILRIFLREVTIFSGNSILRDKLIASLFSVAIECWQSSGVSTSEKEVFSAYADEKLFCGNLVAQCIRELLEKDGWVIDSDDMLSRFQMLLEVGVAAIFKLSSARETLSIVIASATIAPSSLVDTIEWGNNLIDFVLSDEFVDGYNDESVQQREQLARILMHLCKMNPAWLDEIHVRKVLWRYKGSLSAEDLLLKNLLDIYESSKDDAVLIEMIFSNDVSTMQSKLKISNSLFDWFLSSFVDKSRVVASIENFGVNRQIEGLGHQDELQNNSVTSMLDEESDPKLASVYDPAFLLPCIGYLINTSQLNPRKFLESNVFSYLIHGLACRDRKTRGYVHGVLMNLLDIFSSPSLECPERPQLHLLLLNLKNSISESFQQIPWVWCAFLAETWVVLSRPAHDMYPTINHFLLARNEFDFTDLPMFYTCFYSKSMAYQTEKQWLLKLLSQGVSDRYIGSRELSIYQRRYVFSSLFHEYQSHSTMSFYHQKIRKQILVVLLKASQVPELQEILIDKLGIFSWIYCCFIQHEIRPTGVLYDEFMLLVDLYYNLTTNNQEKQSLLPGNRLALLQGVLTSLTNCLSTTYNHYLEIHSKAKQKLGYQFLKLVTVTLADDSNLWERKQYIDVSLDSVLHVLEFALKFWGGIDVDFKVGYLKIITKLLCYHFEESGQLIDTRICKMINILRLYEHSLPLVDHLLRAQVKPSIDLIACIRKLFAVRSSPRYAFIRRKCEVLTSSNPPIV